jgi:xylan 1,4-beta-xylosidase
MGIAHQLNDIDAGMKIVASFPELKDKPIVIGESDPDGCAACPSSLYPQNGYRNGPLYAAYTAASVAREYDLMARDRANLLGAVTWAFEFENQPPFAGFRVLATRGGVALPVLNVFRMLSKMSGDRVAADSSAAISLDDIQHRGVRAAPDVGALASLANRKLCVLLWHYHDDDVPGPAAQVQLSLAGLPPTAKQLKLDHFRIDEHHSNAFAAWQKMGSPQNPTDAQQAELLAASKLQTMKNAPATLDAANGDGKLTIELPRQGVSLIVLTW